MSHISSYSKIEGNQLFLNGNLLFQSDPDSDDDFSKQAYKFLQAGYPKFYKMDTLCKLGFLASDPLLKASGISAKYAPDRIAIVLNNSSSSYDIDVEHQHTIDDKLNYFPSPAVFVYTLPNIVVGEIAIRNNIKGENSLFIFEDYNAEFMQEYVEDMLERGAADVCITGYLDSKEGKNKALLYIVEKGKGSMEHKTEILKQLI